MAKLQNDKISAELDLRATKANETIHQLTKATENLRKQNQEHRKEISRLAATEGDYSAEIKRLNDAIHQNTREIEQNKRKIVKEEGKIDLTRKTAAQLGKELKNLKRQLANTSKAANPKEYRELEKEIRKVEKAQAAATRSTRGFMASLLSLDKVSTAIKGFFMGIAMVVGSLVVGAFRNAFNIVVEFEKENSKLAAILGTTREGIKEMTAAARQLGATTSYSAAQVTQLQIELAKLGFAKQQILDMEGAVLKFAKAVDTDLSSAAAFAGAALRIFNKDASEAEDVLATFAIATTKTALDFPKLQASLSTVGPVAHAFGLSLEDTTALLGQLANAGFDASSAATATRNIILKLCDANGDLARALGGPVKNADELAAGLQKLNAEGVDLAKALELTDKRSVAAFSTFLAQAGSLTELRDAISGVNEEFNNMAGTMADNVAGSMAGLKSAAEELMLKISEGTEGPIKDLIDGLTWLVRSLGDVVEWMKNKSVVIKSLLILLATYKVTLLAAHKAQLLFNLSISAIKGAVSAAKTGFYALIGVLKLLKLNFAASLKSFNAFKVALTSTPWGAVIAAVTALSVTLYTLFSSTEKTRESFDKLNEAEERAKQQAKAHEERREQLINSINTEKAKIMDLVKVAKNENASMDERIKAINHLNAIIPGYCGHLDAERRRLIANDEALQKYIGSMEQRMRLAYYKDEYQKYISEEEAAKSRKRKAEKEWNTHKNDLVTEEVTTHKTYGRSWMPDWMKVTVSNTSERNVKRYQAFDDPYKNALELANQDAARATAKVSDFKAEMDENGIKITDLLEDTETHIRNTGSAIRSTGAAVDAEIEKIKALKKELKDLRKTEASTMEEYQNIEARKEQIREQLKALSGKGKNKKNRHTPGTYSEDSIDEATAPVDDAHQQRLLEINLKRNEMTENEYMVRRSKEMIKYYEDLDKALTDMATKTDATHTQTLDKIQAERNSYALKSAEENRKRIKAETALAQEEYENRLEATNAFYDEQARIIKEETNGNIEMAEATAVYLSEIERDRHRAELAEMERRYDELEDIGEMDLNTWLATRKKLAEEMKKKQNEILNDTAQWAAMMRELSENTTTPEGISASYQLKRSQLAAQYDATIAIARKEGQDVVALEREKQRRITALNFQEKEKEWELLELTGLSWAEEHERELDRIDYYHDQGLIKEKRFQQKKLKMAVDYAKLYFDYYSQLSRSMFTAIQDAEIAKSDAKFDVLIQQAKNNGEDTAALEEEKENKKLAIQKKYADVNFAIKVSQIIADTAVAIMKAYADLGWIGGSIAAAMLTATGAAQVASANAERQKIKNMQPGNTAGNKSSDSPATAERVLSGYADGGYTGDGGRYEIAGVVHRGEYVIPKPIMDNPRVIDAVGTIEAIRRSRIAGAGSIPAPSAGFADGGFTSSASPVDMSDLVAATRELRAAAANIRAHVVLTDLDRAQSDRDRARAPFTRKR